MRASLRLAAQAAASLGAALALTACGAQTGLTSAPADGGVEMASGESGVASRPAGPAGAPGTQGAPEGASDVQASGGAAEPIGEGEAQPAQPPGPLSERLPDGRQTTQPQTAADPVEVALPAIGVRSHLVRLGLDARREMEVPDDFSLAGWYTHAPRPGEPGPAVIAGHVDAGRGTAVFNRLRTLQEGDLVEVLRADGAVVTFAVDRVERHPKDAFPTEAVYGDTDGPELRLITCGGAFDRQARTHRDNVVVFARAVTG